MNNNDILRRIRYIFDFNDSTMIDLFEFENHNVSRAHISNWLKKDDDKDFVELSDFRLAIFLNGLIANKRGKREGNQPLPENRLNNNLIFKKLKIALNLTSDDIIGIFKLVGKTISPHELSAFFRNPKQRKYRPFQDQYLRNFLSGLQIKFRGK